MKIVRTVLGDIVPSSLGLTLGHDHLLTHPPEDVTDQDLVMDNLDATIQELESFQASGGGAIVEMTTVDYGRDAAELEQVSRVSGVHVIAATGFNKGTFADRLTASKSLEEIINWLVAEIRDGVKTFSDNQPRAESSSARAGIIKASSGLSGANQHELKVFEAVTRAHLATNAPISTHTEKGTWGLEQAQFFLERQVAPQKVLIGHLDLKPDLTYLIEIASSGVNLGLDQFGKEKYLPDIDRVKLILNLCEAGFSSQIILGGDMARKSYFRAYGGFPGLAHIPTTIRDMLEVAGINSHQILFHNPQRWLEFEPD